MDALEQRLARHHNKWHPIHISYKVNQMPNIEEYIE